MTKLADQLAWSFFQKSWPKVWAVLYASETDLDCERDDPSMIDSIGDLATPRVCKKVFPTKEAAFAYGRKCWEDEELDMAKEDGRDLIELKAELLNVRTEQRDTDLVLWAGDNVWAWVSLVELELAQ